MASPRLSIQLYSVRDHLDDLDETLGRVVELDVRVVLELDIFWAAAARQDVPSLLRQLGSKVRALHVKDGSLHGDPFAAGMIYDPVTLDQRVAGSGDLDLGEILTAAPWVELDVVEFDHFAGDVFEALGASADYVRRARSR